MVINLGTSLENRSFVLTGIARDVAENLTGKQIAVVTNLAKECVHDCEIFPLSVQTDDGGSQPIQIDGDIPAGSRLQENPHKFMSAKL